MSSPLEHPVDDANRSLRSRVPTVDAREPEACFAVGVKIATEDRRDASYKRVAITPMLANPTGQPTTGGTASPSPVSPPQVHPRPSSRPDFGCNHRRGVAGAKPRHR